MTTHTTSTVIALSIACLAGVHGATISVIPVDWKQSNAFSGQRLASNLSNTTGMNGDGTVLYNLDGTLSGEPTNANGVSWLTSSKANPNNLAGRQAAMADGKVWIIADLGDTYDITTIQIWNFQWNLNGTTDLSDRGANQFDIFVRNTVADTDDGTILGNPINPTGVSDLANALTDAPVFNLGATDPWTLALANQSLARAPNNDTYEGESFDLTGQTARFVAIRINSYHGGAGVGLGKMQFEVIPEPSAALLGGFGLLALLRRRRS